MKLQNLNNYIKITNDHSPLLNWSYTKVMNKKSKREVNFKSIGEVWAEFLLTVGVPKPWTAFTDYIDTTNQVIKFLGFSNYFDMAVIAINPDLNFKKFRYNGFTANSFLVSCHPSITPKFVMKNPRYNWDTRGLAYNPHLDIPFIRYIMQNYQVDSEFKTLISHHPNITWEDITNNLDIRWDFSNGVSLNPNVDWRIIENNFDDFAWSIKTFTSNVNFNLDLVIEYPDLDWDWSVISKHPELDLKKVKQIGITKPWDWDVLSQHIYVDEIFNTYQDTYYKWNFKFISANPDLILEDVRLNPNKNWNIELLLGNKNIQLQLFERGIDVWEFDKIFKYLKIHKRYQVYKKVNGTKLLYGIISDSPCLCWEVVISNPDAGWDLTKIANNKFHVQREYMKKRVKDCAP